MNDPNLQHGAFSWCELMTDDVDKAKTYYSELYGWTMQDYPVESMTYTVIMNGERPVGGIMPFPPDCPVDQPVWGSYVTVDDVDATAARAVELGGRVLVGPRDIPKVGRFCVIQDPGGAVLSAITYLPM